MDFKSTSFDFRSSNLLLLLIVCFFQVNTVQAQVDPKGYGKASYTSEAGKYMRDWLIAGPVAVSADSNEPSEALQEQVFKENVINAITVMPGKIPASLIVDQKNIKWQLISSGGDIVNFEDHFQGKDFVYAYALAEIKASAPASVMLALGSDDGIKVWHNGKLIHENWIPRGVEKDNDLVPVKLVKGSNQILLKIQDMKGGWAFAARLLDKEGLANQLNNAASVGNLDKIKMLIDNGGDINGASKSGITPLIAAKIGGRKEVIQLLFQKGAKDRTVPSAEVLADNFYNSLKEKASPGIAVLVARDGDILYKKGFGYENIKDKIPVTPSTKFRIGSVTKQFTAAAILKLQEENLLNVNDKLSKFIPDFPRGDEVTIHHLLTHSSGIHSYTGKNDFIDRVTKTIAPDSLILYFKNDPYDFNPGEKFLYNNSGYFLLGHIISKVSGKSYDVYLKETFFDPLGMTNTGVHYAGIKLDHEAKGYTKKDDHYEEALDWDMSWAGGAGAMYSTVDDLLKWNQALYANKVISEKSLKAALTPVVLKDGASPSMQYGYGLGLSKYRGVDEIGHSGGLHGFLTQLAYYPKEKLSIVMFTNTSDPEINFSPDKIAEAFLWNKMDTQVSYAQSTVKPKNLDKLVGRYELANVGVLTISNTGDKLFAQLSGQPKFEIFSSSEYEYFWKVVDARLKFIKSESGEISETILLQNGMELKGKRLAEEKIIDIDPAILDNYTGKYKLNDNITVTIIKENNKLFAHPTNQPRLEMWPTSATEFVIKEINAKLSFITDGNGKVNKIMLNMNGSNSELPLIQ